MSAFYQVELTDGRQRSILGEGDGPPVADAGETILRSALLPRALGRFERWDFDAGVIVEDLAPARAEASARVDAEAEAVRGKFVTLGSGQAMSYLTKEAEARAFVAGADVATLAFVPAEAAAIGWSVADLSALIIARADAWRPIGAAIEAIRRGHGEAINAATTLAEIEAAATTDWSAFG